MSMANSFARFALCAALVLSLAGEADARAGSGGSVGSRGSRTFSAPAATPTAPRAAAPIERSTTQPGQPAANQGLLRPAPSAGGGFFGGGFTRGLLGGLLGAGLFGMLMGHGLFGGLGDIMSILGLVLQVGLVVMVVRFAIGYFRRRQPVAAGMGSPSGMMGSSPAPQAVPASAPVNISPTDFNTFEQRLGEIEMAYGNEDINRLRGLTTPEMASFFAEELANNARKGVINRLGSIKLLQGDLSESWREAGGEYASVAMRFGLIDATYDRASNKLVAGNDNVPQEATELWTFRRQAGGGAGDWKLSAIQQA